MIKMILQTKTVERKPIRTLILGEEARRGHTLKDEGQRRYPSFANDNQRWPCRRLKSIWKDGYLTQSK